MRNDTATARLREQHRLILKVVAAFERGMGNDDVLPLNAAAYVDFIRGHSAREDDGLFEVADTRIDGPACAALCSADETVCSRRFEGLTMAQLERTAEELIESYPAG